jgi:hypothetical protein
MNNTFITWLLGAAVAALGLLLLLGTPAAVSNEVASSASLTTNGAAPAPASPSYWQPLGAPSAAATATAAAAPIATPACVSCSTGATGAAITLAPTATLPVSLPPPGGLRGGCGTPTAPCAEAPCGSVMTCGLSTCPLCAHTTHGSSNCGHAACSAATCGHKLSCEVPVCDERPKINRNGPSCVDECSFIQLYSTVPLPVCKAIRFAWAATRGEFLDPYSPTPVYYAPETGFPGGEDVLISLTVTDAQGNKYSDQMKLHVNGGT